MDPNEALLRMRVAMNDYTNATTIRQGHEAAQMMMDNFAALDGWIASGGFLPDEWREPVLLRIRLRLEETAWMFGVKRTASLLRFFQDTITVKQLPDIFDYATEKQ